MYIYNYKGGKKGRDKIQNKTKKKLQQFRELQKQKREYKL